MARAVMHYLDIHLESPLREGGIHPIIRWHPPSGLCFVRPPLLVDFVS